uniref:Alpha-amylase 2 n=1 Tax=Schwanniomyces occidentalis TaxID=27300 RepID=AMY2_SCHOC|nr:RecName: Full=Alpha-amylase 2; AltName: Full=1,4-alpha-D-glucan glucanohydrolase 2; Flags: Precursor [Schwanniomyces occidentalis]CAA51912.1 alpha-amylase [Schwanniomyces occidentalis]prf//2113214A alpha-amylase [Schwanniomyces occidentalis]
MKFATILSTTALALSSLVASKPIFLSKRDAGSSAAAAWRSESIYQLVTDRFARTDGSTSATCNTGDRVYCGGTFQGIIDKLDYIQGMGFTAIWISPVVEQIPDDTGYGYAYHGYWMKDIYAINSNFGTADDLKNLSNELHKRNMKLMVDIVTNHYAWNGAGSSVAYSNYNPFNQQSYFHDYCLITNYDDQTNVEDCWEGDNTVSLPDLRTEDSDVSSIFNLWVAELVSNYSIDGLRIDSAKHVDESFYPSFQSAAGVYLLGEVYDGDPAYTCPYQNYMSGVTNYPLYYPMLRFFQGTSNSVDELNAMISSLESDCKDITLLGNFIENHDQPRLPSYTSDSALIKNAIAFNLMSDGIPIIYYGQEQGYSGSSDPNNREALWLSGYSTSNGYYKLISSVNQIRNQAIYKDSKYTTYWSDVLYASGHVIALQRGADDQRIVSVFNNLGSSGSQTVTFSTKYSGGEKVVDVLTCQTSYANSDSTLTVSISGGAPRIYAPASLIANSGICNF